MSILVTGGLGFVGRRIVDLLVDDGHQVVSYNRDFSLDERPGVTAVQGELFDLPAMVRTFKEFAVDAVIHTAAMSHPEISIELPVTTFAANVDGTLKLLEAMRLAGVRRLVNFSSECAYGHQAEDVPVRENATPMPNTPYGVSKVATEHLGRVYNQLYAMDVVSLRVTEVFGPGLKMPEVLQDMVKAAVRGQTFVLEHGLDHRFHFVYVDDVARAAISASKSRSLTQAVYNISGGLQVTLKEVRERILQRVPGAAIHIGPGHIPDWDRQGPFDISAAARDLDYRPQVSLDAGLDSLLNEFSMEDL
ncbi:NAD-dependent epimerase/dehydratase family protein [Nocardioides sp.]|uniref:NAD-dependent epimerase/dehydratase family protein n=1 Tax=Nocardioides sp. TaxID=35761 RepID=UPI003784A607